MPRKHRPHTPDGRYLVSKGIMKRCSNPSLGEEFRRKTLKSLMQARMKKDRSAALEAKVALGEAGPLWWDDDPQDYSGYAPESTPYKRWWDALSDTERDAGQ